MSNDNVISIDYFKEKKTNEVVDFIKNCDEHMLVEFLARTYVEFESMNKSELGDQLVEKGINFRKELLLKLVKQRIDQLKGDDETSSD